MLVLCSSQPARDWKSCFFFFYFFQFFSFWSSFFWLENYHFLFIPVKFFHYFFISVFPPFGIFIFLSFASKMVLGPWELPPEAFSRTLFVCFFRLLLRFSYFFFPMPLKLTWGIAKRSFFSNPFRFFFIVFLFFLRFGIFFLPLPLKLTSGIAKRSFFSNPFHFFFIFFMFFRFFFVLVFFPSFCL